MSYSFFFTRNINLEIIIASLIFTFSTFKIFAQTLTITNDSSISVDVNSSIFVDGLELIPSSTYIVSGPNEFNRTTTPVVIGENSSIDRVYTFAEELLDYSGVIAFTYKDIELNGISELELVLEVQDGIGQWTDFTPIIDYVNNTLTYDFTELVNFTAVTASSVNATLSVDPTEVNNYVRVYPNPTTDFLHIVSNTAQKATLFNTAGQKILETNNATSLDVIDLPSGVYLLNLQNTQNQISTFKIIKN